MNNVGLIGDTAGDSDELEHGRAPSRKCADAVLRHRSGVHERSVPAHRRAGAQPHTARKAGQSAGHADCAAGRGRAPVCRRVRQAAHEWRDGSETVLVSGCMK